MNTFFKKAIALTLLVSACVVSKSVLADYYKGYTRKKSYSPEMGYEGYQGRTEGEIDVEPDMSDESETEMGGY